MSYPQYGQQPQQSWEQGHQAPPNQWDNPYAAPPAPRRRQAAPPPKKKKWPYVVGGIVAVLVLGSALNSGKSTPTVGVAPSGSTAQQPAAAAPAEPADSATLIYEIKVQGGGSASVTYMTKSGMSQETPGKTPWTKRVDGGFLGGSLVGQKKSGNGSQITCTVKDTSGKILAENVSSGPYAVCTAAGW